MTAQTSIFTPSSGKYRSSFLSSLEGLDLIEKVGIFVASEESYNEAHWGAYECREFNKHGLIDYESFLSKVIATEKIPSTGNLIIDASMEAPGFDSELFDRGVEFIRKSSKVNRCVVLGHGGVSIEKTNLQGDQLIRAGYYHRFWVYLFSYSKKTLLDERRLDFRRNKMLTPLNADQRRFSCLISKLRESRVVIFGRILRLNALNHGYVSLHCSNVSQDSKRSIQEIIQSAREFFPRMRKDIDAFCEFAGPIPFYNFEYNPKRENDITSTEIIPYRDVKVCLVPESEMDNSGGTRRFTEKSLKPLQSGNIPLIAGNSKTLSELERAGFQLPNTIGADYDHIEDREERLETVLENFESLLRYSDSEFQDLCYEYSSTSQYNSLNFNKISERNILSHASEIINMLKA